MKIPYTCSDQDPLFPHTWEGQIIPIDPAAGEMEVTANGSFFHIICGRYLNGHYLCIPNINVGTDLSEPDDVFWNRAHLSACYPNLSETDIISITEALAVAGRCMDI